jgi:hypothetical protein
VTENERTAGHATTDRPDSLRRLRFPVAVDRTPWTSAEVDAVLAALKVRLPRLVDTVAAMPSTPDRDRMLVAMLAFAVDMEGDVS